MKFVMLLFLLSVIVTIIYAISDECPQCNCCSGNCKTWEDSRCTDTCTEEACSGICAENCKTCVSNATCAVCEDGFYKGKNMDDDTNSYYVDCRLRCRTGCATCSAHNVCGLCSPGYYKSQELCLPCSRGCLVCSKSDHCTECKTGFFLEENKCFNCPSNCLTCSERYLCDVCKAGLYGVMCHLQCSANCTKCDKEFGNCTVDNSKDEINECDECKEVSTAEVPVTEDNANCPTHCESCDENGVCLLCKVGYWSERCDKHCSPDCSNKTCDTDTGNCTLVRADEVNNTTSERIECPTGYYGDECNQTCPINCRGSLCGIINGDCLGGCNGKYFGVKCDKECENECLDCSNDNDTCVCIPGYFGETCNKTCPSSCNNFGCYRYNGSCLNDSLGCKDGDDCYRNDVTDEVTAKIIIGAVFGSFGFAMATVVAVVILILRMRLRRVRGELII